jgi:hypothetical protein
MITNCYEYKIVKGNDARDEKHLNFMGGHRWKLCGVINDPVEGIMLYFGRNVHVCHSGPPD